ncbi:MAG: NYN domain-containing protein [Anaerolineae bacterium]|nr:NYN domain-containing protein [Anaerolineae bacterium]
MAAYLIVDVDDLLRRFQERGMSVDLQELAVGLRGGAALAAGLVSVDKLKAIAVANWSLYSNRPGILDPQYIFKAAGYEVFEITHRASLADVLIIHYFSYDPDPIDELILATTSRDLLPLIRRIKVTRSARIRMWGSEDVLKGTEFADEIIFQPLETLLGIQSKNVAVYIDFENIAISLNEQGFIVNLDHLIERFVAQAKAHGQLVKMAAYAPWGQRGTLPPLLDRAGREIADDAPTRLMMANIDPVFNLPGKNSADIRIARDVITDSGRTESGDVFILASGDRDFNDVINTLVQRGKPVIIWSVRGSTSRQIEQHPAVTLEYIEDFTSLQTHQSLSTAPVMETPGEAFNPSLWSSVIIQFDWLTTRTGTRELSPARLLDRLTEVGAVVVRERGEDLLAQAQALGVLRPAAGGMLLLNVAHPLVDKTRIVRDAIARRVANTLKVRGWMYVNYGFLLNGLEMERDISRPGMNLDDQWRSHWIDALVREQILQRELVPHRHNPDDLVPVIRLPDDYIEPGSPPGLATTDAQPAPVPGALSGPGLAEVAQDTQSQEMCVRIIVSVEQFTSFRSFAWCPLGSLHRRLRPFDSGMAFQRAVEYLEAMQAVVVSEYPNPQSNFNTKGISLNTRQAYVQEMLHLRDDFIRVLLRLYERNSVISPQRIQEESPEEAWNIPLWISIMETENVLNLLPGRAGQYSLFRTHHTVKLVAGDAS